MKGFNACVNGHIPKPDIDEMIYGDVDTMPSER